MKRADKTYKSQVIDILSASFDNNQSINYIVKQDSRRMDRLRGLMAYCFEVCLENGQVFMNDDHTACALVLHSDKKIGLWKNIQLNVNLAMKSIGIFRVQKVLKREKLIRANHPKEPFYYLWFIGVAPEGQGKGIGSKLLEEVIQSYSKASRPFYLETSVLQNLPWYEKYGFQIFKEIDLGYKLYLMLRPK